MPACEDTLRTYQALLTILSDTPALGTAINELKMLPGGNTEYHQYAEPAPVVAMYCRLKSAVACREVAAGISDAFKDRHPDIYWNARVWRAPRFNTRLGKSRLVFIANGNADTKLDLSGIREGSGGSIEAAKYWLEPLPTATGIAKNLEDYYVWGKMQTPEYKIRLLHAVGSCPHGWCSYKDELTGEHQPVVERTTPKMTPPKAATNTSTWCGLKPCLRMIGLAK